MKKSKKTTKRSRRSYDQRIADLEAELERQKELAASRKRKQAEKRELPPSIKQIPKIAKTLQAFAGRALEDKRQDVFNSVSMFLAGLQRVYKEELAKRVDDDAPDESASDAAAGGATNGATNEPGIVPMPRQRPQAQSSAERDFDERLKSVARNELKRRIESTGLSEWER